NRARNLRQLEVLHKDPSNRAAMVARFKDPVVHELSIQALRTPESRARRSRIRRRAMAEDPRILYNMIRKAQAKPNHLEATLLAWLRELDPEGKWKFVGDGSAVITDQLGALSPDFFSAIRRAYVDAFGTYWHRGEDPAIRIQRFGSLGYPLLIVWEHDVKARLHPAKEQLRAFVLRLLETRRVHPS